MKNKQNFSKNEKTSKKKLCITETKPHNPVAKNSITNEENVKIYQKLLTFDSTADQKLLKIKSRSNNDKDRMMVSEEEFYEITNMERENMGYLINDYFAVNFDNQTFLNKKQQMKTNAEKLHNEHRVRIHQFYDKIRNIKHYDLRKNSHKKSSSLIRISKNKLPDWFSKYNQNFIHIDLIVNEKNCSIEEKLRNSYDEEKCLKKIMKIYKDNKTRYWVDSHHYNRMINKPYKEKIQKSCCKAAENKAMDCHQNKYSLMTFYKFMEEVLKDIEVYGRLWVLTYDYYLTPENFLIEIIKLFFIPIPLFLSENELKKFISYKILPKQKKTIALLNLWIELRPEDFLISRNLALLLKAFILIIDLKYKENFNEEIKFLNEKILLNTFPSVVPARPRLKIEDRTLIISAFIKDRKNNCHILDLDNIPSLISQEAAVFFAIDSDTIVQQFCLIDYEMYKELKPYILSNSFKNPTNSRVLNKIVQRYNFLTYFFILTIILQKETQAKAKIILKFLDIAEKCVKYQNFQSLITICNALSHFLVLRFKSTWDSLSESSKNLNEKMMDSMCFNQNYRKLRRMIKLSKGPFIPCLNIILRDINQIDAENEWVFLRDNEFVNLKKMESLNEIVTKVTEIKNEAFIFEKNPFFYGFFENSFQKVLEHYVQNKIENIEEKLFELSKNIEKK